MPGEFDPAEELGLFPDRIFVTNCRGFITMNNYLRDLCARFVRNGAQALFVISNDGWWGNLSLIHI